MEDRDDFEKWVQQWAAAEQELAQERASTHPQQQQEPMRASFFTGAPAEYDFVDSQDDGSLPNDDWHDIYQRAMEIDQGDENLITDAVNIAYAGEEGYGRQIPTGVSPKPGKKVYTQNPINFASVGNDQEDDDGRVRVTNNWSDGKELKELADIKRQVEILERKFHDADVLSKKAERSKFESQLKNLRNRVKELSEKLTSDPQDDLT